MRQSSPYEFIRASADLALLAWETQMVMAMRIAGMAGMWSVVPSENDRMVSEKGPAFAEAAAAATMALARGSGPAAVTQAWMRPLRRRTGANARRLSKRGPRIG